MNSLDVIVISIVLLGIIWGIRKGFIGIVVLVIGIIVTIVVVDSFSEPLSVFFGRVGVSENISYVVAIVTIIVISFIVFFIIQLLLKNLIDLFRIGWINRSLGAIVGGWVLFVFIGSIIFFLTKIPFINFKSYVESSAIAKYSYAHAKYVMSLSGSEEKINKIIDREVK
ncbi:MAG: CvpA family protein [Brevinematia bacterium]